MSFSIPFSALYETATGKLLSIGSVVDFTDEELAARGITRSEIPPQHYGLSKTGQPKMAPGRRWNETTKSFDVIVLPREISTAEFWERFTDAEQANIYDQIQNGAPNVRKQLGAFKDKLMIVKAVDLNSQRFAAAVHAIEDAGIINPGRAAEILS